MRKYASWLVTMALCVVIIAAGFSFFAWRSRDFHTRCDRVGGHVETLFGRDGHMLCLSPDNRLLFKI